MNNPGYDFLIVGSGFSGSIAAMALSGHGYSVCLVENSKHPRFAVGESSTPIADMVLRDLADQYNLPFLKELSRYGTWQKHHPELVCGLKRGFSYYSHQPDELYRGDLNHSCEMLVAASVDQENSDTNWLRSDVDHFLAKKAAESGTDFFDDTAIVSVNREAKLWNVTAGRGGKQFRWNAKIILDATGSPTFSEKFLGTTSTNEGFRTRSRAVFTHLDEAENWSSYLYDKKCFTDDYPYNPDHSALHQLIEEGWVWMLRFNTGRLSTGLVLDMNSVPDRKMDPAVEWKQILERYPSVSGLFQHARLSDMPGGWVKTGRLQRKLDRTFGEGWVALNHTAGFIDPLHSTGIAHTLTGLEKLLSLLTTESNELNLNKGFAELENEFLMELDMIDRLVSVCYISRHHFKLFSAAVMLYFIASIRYEQARLSGKAPRTFLCADQPDLTATIHRCSERIMQSAKTGRNIDNTIQYVREELRPMNDAGLMDPERNNMYTHTAVQL